MADQYQNPETTERYTNAYKKHLGKSGKLEVKDILDALIDAKEENYTEDDIVDVLEVMEVKNEPLPLEKFLDMIQILKDPETIVDAFKVFDKEGKGTVPEGDLREWIHKYSNLKGKEVEDAIAQPHVTQEKNLQYKGFVEYWSTQ